MGKNTWRENFRGKLNVALKSKIFEAASLQSDFKIFKNYARFLASVELK
jgi:hypothetical protein